MRAVIVDPAVAVVDRQQASVQLPPVRQDAPFVTIVVVQASAQDAATQKTLIAAGIKIILLSWKFSPLVSHAPLGTGRQTSCLYHIGTEKRSFVSDIVTACFHRPDKV